MFLGWRWVPNDRLLIDVGHNSGHSESAVQGHSVRRHQPPQFLELVQDDDERLGDFVAATPLITRRR